MPSAADWSNIQTVWGRIADASQLDSRTEQIIGCQFMAEQALDEALSLVLPRPDRLAGFGFRQKVTLIGALVPGDTLDEILALFEALNDVRNKAAHKAERTAIDKLWDRIIEGTRTATPFTVSGSLALEMATHHLCAALIGAAMGLREPQPSP